MKKRLFRSITVSSCAMIAALLMSCSHETVESSKSEGDTQKIENEFNLLTSEAELNALLSRGDEGIVDWELAKEIAQMQLESFIEDGDYPETSELWRIPIGIYNEDGEIRYYEFRVVNDGEVIAAITINAQESLGGPVAYVFSMNGYTD